MFHWERQGGDVVGSIPIYQIPSKIVLTWK